MPAPAGESRPVTPATPERLLGRVARAVDALLAAADAHGGLFPSLLDRRSGAMLETLPPPIAGQRSGDRSHPIYINTATVVLNFNTDVLGIAVAAQNQCSYCWLANR